jgi:hypothetical protein
MAPPAPVPAGVPAEQEHNISSAKARWADRYMLSQVSRIAGAGGS